jgi:hypothetical protein
LLRYVGRRVAGVTAVKWEDHACLRQACRAEGPMNCRYAGQAAQRRVPAVQVRPGNLPARASASGMKEKRDTYEVH